jgi:serine/threonine protein kinase
MSADEPLDDLAGAILDGSHVDWHLVETRSVGTGEEVSIRGLKAIEQIAIFNRALQRRPGSPAVASPEHWGDLILLERASSGRTGEIWRAWDPWLQREVALKFLLTIGDSAIDDRALLAEARALARVRHPGVVAVHGLAEHAGRIGMWMELLTGDTLEVEIARRGALSASEVGRIGLELSRALEAIAAAGLVHRDIKPANIILESSGRIVLTDFGLGRRMALSEQEPWRSSGTPMFMSPERLHGEPSTPRSDLYALGVTLRWALTGRCPFHARTIEELKRETETGPSEPLTTGRTNAPEVLIEAIETAMAARVD